MTEKRENGERKGKKTFERASEFEDGFGDGNDFRTDTISGKKSDAVAFGWCGGGAPDPAGSGELFGNGFKIKGGFEGTEI